MNFLKLMGLFLTILILSTCNLFAQSPSQQVVFSSGKAEITIEDHLHHPFYWWPTTLLSYPIIFNEAVAEKELILVNGQTGNQQPFQLIDVGKTPEGKISAMLHFMSDLPSGGKRVFTLQRGIPENFPLILAERRGNELLIESDKLTIWIPSSQQGATGLVPGPVLRISQDINKPIGGVN